MKTFVVNGTKIQANSQVEAIKKFKDAKAKDWGLPRYNDNIADKIDAILDELNIDYDGDIQNGIAVPRSKLSLFKSELDKAGIDYEEYDETRSSRSKQGINFFDSKCKDANIDDVRSEQNLAGMFRWWNNAMRINEDGTVEVRTEDKDDFMNACIDRSYAKYIAVVSPKHDGWVRYKVNDSKMNDYVGSFLMHQTNENTRKLAMQLADLAKADGHNLPLPDAYELIDESFNEKADTLQRFYQWVKHIGWHDSINDSDQTEIFKEIQSKYPGVKFKNVEFEASDRSNSFTFEIYGNLPQNLDRFDHTKKVSFERFVEYLLKKHGYANVYVYSDTRSAEMLVNVRARKYFKDSVNDLAVADVYERIIKNAVNRGRLHGMYSGCYALKIKKSEFENVKAELEKAGYTNVMYESNPYVPYNCFFSDSKVNDSVNDADIATVNELNAIMKHLVEAVVASENFRQKHDLDRITFDNLIKNISKAQDNVNFILRNIDIVVKK